MALDLTAQQGPGMEDHAAPLVRERPVKKLTHDEIEELRRRYDRLKVRLSV